MILHPNGDLSGIPAEQRLNVYALVIYIPDPLGAFLDDLRRELVPLCNPHAHVSVLPPRSLALAWQVAAEQVRTYAREWAAFEVHLGDIGRFPVTNVIYIELEGGAAQLHGMHARMNTAALASPEPFVYHPHITLAQELQAGQVEEVHRLARRRWEEFTGPRTFRAERATFVQNTIGNCWIDLAAFPLSTGVLPAR
jgi:2'-5' RNA ligase